MTRRSLLSMFFAMIAMVMVGVVGTTREAAAQQNLNLCHYIVDIAGIVPCCFPITLQTEWTCPPPGGVQIHMTTYANNGIFTHPLNPNGFPPCPPACMFNWASLAPLMIPTPLGGTNMYMINGCCYTMRVTTDPTGAILIIIRPCC